ncbi:melanocortin receptor 5-like [Scyliorhinus canicula]|uniref:melanocortin receptor 5-like n=1 Tax=Scyliorhinus canicula TaxID=7830 RepID=UPI0018F3CEB6|nr:melanocortin receptor 5-like [Scyliorhinus canicula]XP_038675235.1 melanocortin receptor 5-like [Scyliorhinus canicula]
MPVALILEFGGVGYLILFVFHVSLATSIVLINASVLLALLIRKFFLKENRFLFMLSTCISDLGTGVSWYYSGLFDTLDAFPPRNGTYFIGPTFMGLSYLITLAAQADRYHAIISPFRYAQRMTRTRTGIVIACLWIYAYTVAAVQNLVTSAIGMKISGIGSLICNLTTYVIMVVLNIKLYLIAKYQLEKEPPSAARENKRTSLYLIVVVASCFLAFWLPIFLNVIVCSFSRRFCLRFRTDGLDPLRILPRVNAALTPVLYIRGCAPLKEIVMTRVWKCCRRGAR